MTLLEELKIYAAQVREGSIVACQKHKWACLRFEKDIERSENEDPTFPYWFDEDRAETVLDWCGMFKHRKGVLAGKPIELSPIHRFLIIQLYGWRHKETNYRRFNKFYWQVARKNAKSQMASLIASVELFLSENEEVVEVYCAATKREQAKIVYEETVKQLENCDTEVRDELAKMYRVAYGKIETSNGSIMRALSEEDRKTGDGLNPNCGIIDEYHAHETSEIYDILDSGMGARPQPLLVIITTAGFELNNPCYRVEYDLVSRILNPDNPTNIDSYLVMVNELDRNDTGQTIEIDGRKIEPGELIDDINDEAAWEKANPIICSYPEGRAYLRKKIEEAKEAPEKMKNVKTKHLNIWVNERSSGYLALDRWTASVFRPNEKTKTIYDAVYKNTNRRAYIGLDLAAKTDLVSVGFEFRGTDDKYYVLSHSFMPQESFLKRIKEDKIPYDIWEKQGWLTITEGAVVDYRAAMHYALTTCKENEWQIEEFALDMWGALQLSADLIELGHTVVEIIQGMKTLSEPTKDFRNMVYSDRIIHDGSPVLSWALGNAVTREDHNKNFMLDKSKAKQRIDPAAAIMNAHTRAMVPSKKTSVYSERGLRSFED